MEEKQVPTRTSSGARWTGYLLFTVAFGTFVRIMDGTVSRRAFDSWPEIVGTAAALFLWPGLVLLFCAPILMLKRRSARISFLFTPAKFFIGTLCAGLLLLYQTSLDRARQENEFRNSEKRASQSQRPHVTQRMEQTDNDEPTGELGTTRKAAENNNANAQYTLAKMYATGAGVPQDKPEAVKWFRKAAAQNHVNAQLALFSTYSTGDGVAVDQAEALEWCRKAAEGGQPTAQSSLATKYFTGEGVETDEVEAYKWCLLSAAGGSKAAQSFASLIEQRLTAAQIAEGHRRADAFKSRSK
jgi:hypothetical protein